MATLPLQPAGDLAASACYDAGMSCTRRWALRGLVSLLLLATAVLVAAERRQVRAAPPPVPLAGQLLVASPTMSDPRFAHTVIYMVAHDGDGAVGLVVNREVGEGSLKALLRGFGVEDADVAGSARLQYGGPVEPSRGFVLHSADYSGRGTRVIGDNIALSTGFDVLRALASGDGPQRRRFYLGYAGWGPGQLEGEIAHEDWMTAPADPSLIFGDEGDDLWERVMKSAGQTL